MRGYLHGGIIIDLIGQKGPTSKFRLVVLDLVIIVLQCFMLAVHVERERLSAITAAFANPVTAPAAGVAVGTEPRAEVVTTQDHDAEERGVVREGETTNGDIELRPLETRHHGPSAVDGHDVEELSEERERLLAEPAPRPEDVDNALDIFWRGNAVVGEFHVLHILLVPFILDSRYLAWIADIYLPLHRSSTDCALEKDSGKTTGMPLNLLFRP